MTSRRAICDPRSKISRRRSSGWMIGSRPAKFVPPDSDQSDATYNRMLSPRFRFKNNDPSLIERSQRNERAKVARGACSSSWRPRETRDPVPIGRASALSAWQRVGRTDMRRATMFALDGNVSTISPARGLRSVQPVAAIRNADSDPVAETS